MAIRSDSYSSTSEVEAYTKHLLDGQSAYNSTTRPTSTEVEKFIDRASGLLNIALRDCGLTVPITNSTAKLACDDWVTNRATAYAELTHRGAGFDGTENTRAGSFIELNKDAQEFALMMCPGMKKIVGSGGITDKISDGLQFTGLDARDERSDPDDTSLRQPIFERGDWDDKETSDYADENEGY